MYWGLPALMVSSGVILGDAGPWWGLCLGTQAREAAFDLLTDSDTNLSWRKEEGIEKRMRQETKSIFKAGWGETTLSFCHCFQERRWVHLRRTNSCCSRVLERPHRNRCPRRSLRNVNAHSSRRQRCASFCGSGMGR